MAREPLTRATEWCAMGFSRAKAWRQALTPPLPPLLHNQGIIPQPKHCRFDCGPQPVSHGLIALAQLPALHRMNQRPSYERNSVTKLLGLFPAIEKWVESKGMFGILTVSREIMAWKLVLSRRFSHLDYLYSYAALFRVSDVKSLIRLRAASKQWKSFIDNSQFIAAYGARKTHPHSLLLRSNWLLSRFVVFVWNKQKEYVLWNASIRRSVGIVHRNLIDAIFGFAVCPVTNEPIIVKYSYPWIVDIFTLSSKRWTEIPCSKPCKSIQFREWSNGRSQTRSDVKAVCLFFVSQTRADVIPLTKMSKTDIERRKSEENITHWEMGKVKLRESLVQFLPDTLVGVWKMEHDCSFAKLFTFNTPERSITKILGFRKNDELVMETREEQFWFFDSVVEVYQPWLRNIIRFPIYGQRDSFFISSYKETLLLLDHLDSSVYDNDC
ncbi:hypothetical protein Tco_1094206 [Tanacetum coccineum]|uniref:F-box domain-containing protein n=1 Tax=Tanacetum coccineum TaxID=301880 RepID=A0ABQ5IEV2_9ASTR